MTCMMRRMILLEDTVPFTFSHGELLLHSAQTCIYIYAYSSISSSSRAAVSYVYTLTRTAAVRGDGIHSRVSTYAFETKNSSFYAYTYIDNSKALCCDPRLIFVHKPCTAKERQAKQSRFTSAG